ncbi:hypothetical protein ACHAXH_009074 [Discostella pseudostelligera]
MQQTQQQLLNSSHRNNELYIGHPPQKARINNHNNRSGYFTTLFHYFKGSIHLAILSHLCFVIGCLFYIKLSFIQLRWIQYAVIENDLTTDDDLLWNQWANENPVQYRKPPTHLQLNRLTYGNEYTKWYSGGAALFTLVGVLDWLRYCDNWNIFMILAGLAGFVSGFSMSERAAAIWGTISVHLYFLESVTLLKRVHYYPQSTVNANVGMMMKSGDSKVDDSGIVVGDHYLEGISGGCGVMGGSSDGGGSSDNRIYIRDATTYIDEHGDADYPCFRMGDVFFFVGSTLDIFGSYTSLVGMEGMWTACMDLVSCFLWLGCALVAILAEIFYLQKQVSFFRENGGEYYDLGSLNCY